MNNDVELIPVKGVLPSVQVQSDNVIYVPQAHKNKAGIVKEGDGVLIENGVVSLNRQTVEDMIDANKWVSYGFQQNLTEDEKGMARHNIGAGDNYFTGSYYDLTQKPHLNTNNTTGLDYGDEELNDTINLHKISKTGSFNDLKHVPQETIDFAESERQKSKNLLDINKVKFKAGSEAFSTLSNGTITINAGNVFCYMSNLTDLCNLKPNIPYTLSYVTSNGRNYIYQYYDNNTGFNWSVGETKIFTQEEINKISDNLLLFYGSDTEVVTYSNIQIEEGSVATDYQPYNGAIVHEKEIEITIGDATLNTDVISSGEVSWVKQGKLVVVSFSDIKFKSPVAHQNLYFSGLPKKAIKSQTFLLHQMNAHGGSSLRCMMQKDSTQIVNWYQDTTLDTNAQYYGQFTYITDEN